MGGIVGSQLGGVITFFFFFNFSKKAGFLLHKANYTLFATYKVNLGLLLFCPFPHFFSDQFPYIISWNFTAKHDTTTNLFVFNNLGIDKINKFILAYLKRSTKILLTLWVTVILSTVLQSFCQLWGSWPHQTFVNG